MMKPPKMYLSFFGKKEYIIWEKGGVNILRKSGHVRAGPVFSVKDVFNPPLVFVLKSHI